MEQDIKGMLLTELQNIINKLNRVPTKLELINYTCFSFYLYKKTFGSLNKAIESLNYKPQRIRFRTKEEVIDALNSVYKKINKKPTTIEFLKYSGIDDAVARRAFGNITWDEICFQVLQLK